jgi:hypothetical protein
MSTDYITEKKVPIAALHGTLLSNEGVHVHKVESERYIILTDGESYLHARQCPDGELRFSRYGGNMPGFILGTISRLFDTEIYSEYCPQYWGFSTKQEWDAAFREIDADYLHESYLKIQKFLRGDPVDIRPDTIQMVRVLIAKELVEADPSLLLPENEARLMTSIETIYSDRHVTRIKIPEDQMQRIQAMTDADALLFADAKQSDPW